MKKPKWHFLLPLVLVSHLKFVHNETEDFDEIVAVDLSRRGRSITEIRSTVKDALRKCDLVPGKNAELMITPPTDVKYEFTQEIAEIIREILPSFIDTSDTAFSISAQTDDKTNFLLEIKVDIKCGFLRNSRSTAQLAKKEILETFNVQLDLQSDLSSKLSTILQTALEQSRNVSETKQPTCFIIALELPKGVGLVYEHSITAILKAQLKKLTGTTSSFNINSKMLRNTDGSVEKIEYIIDLIPNMSQEVDKFVLNVESTNLEESKMAKKLIERYLMGQPESSCRPMDIQINLLGANDESVESLGTGFRVLLETMLPERKFEVSSHVSETSTNKNVFDIEIGCAEPSERRFQKKPAGLSKLLPSFGFNHELIIDLSHQGVTMASNLKKVLPNILSQIQAQLRTTNFVSLSFSITTPPGQGPGYVNFAQRELLQDLSTYLPDCRIDISATPIIGHGGFLTNVIFDVSLERLQGGMEGAPNFGADTTLIIDFGGQDTNIIYELRSMILNLLPKITADMRSGMSVYFSLKIETPRNPNPSLMKSIQDDLTSQLAIYFPNCEISVTPKNKKTYLILEVSLKPSRGGAHVAVGPPAIDEIVINLPPDASVVSMISKILESKLSMLQSILSGNNPVTLEFGIQTSGPIGPHFLQNANQDITTTMTKFFPNKKIEVRPNTDSTNGLKFIVIISPGSNVEKVVSPSTFEIDLGKTGVVLENEMNGILTKLLPQFQKDLAKRISQSFNIKVIAPPSSKPELAKDIAGKIGEIIGKSFPNHYVTINTLSNLDEQGYLSKTMVEVLLHPGGGGNHQKFIPPNEMYKIKIDLRNVHGLFPLIRDILKNLFSTAKNNLNYGKPVGFTFEIKPSGTTQKINIKTIESSILTQVIELFPNLRLDSSIDFVKDNQDLENAEIHVIIQPINRDNELETVVHPNKFLIDLSTDSSSVDHRIREVVEKVLLTIIGKDIRPKSHTIQIIIKPPKVFDENFIHLISDRVVDILSRYLPDYFVESITNAIMESSNRIREIISLVNLIPGKIPEDIDASKTPSFFEVVLPDGKAPINQIGQWIQSNLTNIFSELKTKPVILVIDIQPPQKSRTEFEVILLNQIKELIVNLFHRHNIRFEVRGLQNIIGVVNSMNIIVKIEPSSETDDVDDSISAIWEINPGDHYGILKPPGVDQVGVVTPPGVDGVGVVTPPGVDGVGVVTPPGVNQVNMTDPSEQEKWEIKPPENKWTIVGPLGANLEDVTEPPEANPSGVPPIDTFKPQKVAPVTIGPDTNLEELIDSDFRNRVIDIYVTLIRRDEYKFPIVVYYPNGINRQNVDYISQIIQDKFEIQFQNDIVRCVIDGVKGSGDSVIKANIEIIIKKPEQNEILIDMSQQHQDISKLMEIKLSEYRTSILDSLKRDEKSEIHMNIVKPNRVSPKFVLDSVDTLQLYLKRQYPNLNTCFNIPLRDTKVLSVDIYFMVPKSQDLSPEISTTFEVPILSRDALSNGLIDETLDSIHQTIKPFVDEKKSLRLDFNIDQPANGANEMSIKQNIDYLKDALKRRYPNTAVGVNPFKAISEDHKLVRTHLEITLEPFAIAPSTILETFDMDLSLQGSTVKTELAKILPSMKQKVQDNLDQNRPVDVNLNIRPPKGATDSFLPIISEVIIPTLASPYCNYDKEWSSTPDFDFNGNLNDVLLSLTIKPSPNYVSGKSEAMKCVQNIVLDLTDPESKLDKEIDRIIPRIINNVQMNLEQGKTQSLNFKIHSGQLANKDYLKNTAEKLLEILQNYFPYNKIKIRIEGKQNGKETVATITIIVEPDPNPLPPSAINIPLHLFKGSGVKLQVKDVMHKFMQQIKSELESVDSVVIGFRINTLNAVGEQDFKKLSEDLMEAVSEIFNSKTIQVQSKAARNSKGEYVKILMAVTIS